MNERIKELAVQSGFLAVGDFDNPVLIIGFEHDGIVSLQLTKFAELIIRQCIWAAQNKDDTSMDLRYGRAVAAGKIREHFGVEVNAIRARGEQ
jgi:hypothetical protein